MNDNTAPIADTFNFLEFMIRVKRAEHLGLATTAVWMLGLGAGSALHAGAAPPFGISTLLASTLSDLATSSDDELARPAVVLCLPWPMANQYCDMVTLPQKEIATKNGSTTTSNCMA